MTVKEVNKLIKDLEVLKKELKEKEKEKRAPYDLSKYKDEFLEKAEKAIQDLRTECIFKHEDALTGFEVFQKVCSLASIADNNEYILKDGYIFGDLNHILFILKSRWADWVQLSIMKITKGRAQGILSKRTGEPNLTKEEFDDVVKELQRRSNQLIEKLKI